MKVPTDVITNTLIGIKTGTDRDEELNTEREKAMFKKT